MGKQKKENEVSGLNMSMKGMVDVLRLCTVLLAVVSFWSTAQGMTNYVFSEKWQAYAGSLAIQGILLGLNFSFPTFWHLISSVWKKMGLIIMTIVVLCCSSWFSFIFIVEHVYGQSWDVESRLLIQSTYRKQLYAANDYANNYKVQLADDLAQQIMDLYAQAKELADDEFKITNTIEWEKERDIYTDNDFAARSEMLTIINAVEAASEENASVNEKERAIEIIIEMRSGLQNACDSFSQRIQDANVNITAANENVQAAQRSLNMATEETDRASLIAAVESAQGYLESQQEMLRQLQEQLTDYQEAVGRVQIYEINLGLLSGGSGNLISASLKGIQQELFHENPNLDYLETQAVDVFQVLQNTVDASVSEGEKYQELLNNMNCFITDLRVYSIMTGVTESFDILIEELRNSSEDLVSANTEWKEEWSQRLDGLKSQIAALPAYSGTEHKELLDYDRALASDMLDEMIRLYIADHNAAQQGIIYLFSPYWELALFSLILAFFLDIAAFITGMFIEVIEQKKEESVMQGGGMESSKEESEEYDNLSFCIPGLNKYLYLNGDYVHEEEKSIYRAIEEGKEIEICLPEMGLRAGLYVEDDKGWTRVTERQELRLISEPQDGIYINSIIKCNDYALSIVEDKNESSQYLATIKEDVPAYILERNHLDVIPAYLLGEREEKIVVVAVNQKGTAVTAVYICDKCFD